jgi:hypothetical protein
VTPENPEKFRLVGIRCISKNVEIARSAEIGLQDYAVAIIETDGTDEVGSKTPQVCLY